MLIAIALVLVEAALAVGFVASISRPGRHVSKACQARGRRAESLRERSIAGVIGSR